MVKENIKINYEQGIISKHSQREEAELEVATTLEAYKLAEKTRLFRVPKVIDFDLHFSTIKFELIPDIVPLTHLLLAKTKNLDEIIYRVGKILSVVHLNLSSHVGKIAISNYIESNQNRVFLHGDFNFNNVQYNSERDEIVILDWALTPIFGGNANWGTHFWDVYWMMNSIFSSPPYIGSNYRYRKQLAEFFVSGYESKNNLLLDKFTFYRYCLKVNQIVLEKLRRRTDFVHYMIYMPNRIMFIKYIRSLEN